MQLPARASSEVEPGEAILTLPRRHKHGGMHEPGEATTNTQPGEATQQFSTGRHYKSEGWLIPRTIGSTPLLINRYTKRPFD